MSTEERIEAHLARLVTLVTRLIVFLVALVMILLVASTWIAWPWIEFRIYMDSGELTKDAMQFERELKGAFSE